MATLRRRHKRSPEEEYGSSVVPIETALTDSRGVETKKRLRPTVKNSSGESETSKSVDTNRKWP